MTAKRSCAQHDVTRHLPRAFGRSQELSANSLRLQTRLWMGEYYFVFLMTEGFQVPSHTTLKNSRMLALDSATRIVLLVKGMDVGEEKKRMIMIHTYKLHIEHEHI